MMQKLITFALSVLIFSSPALSQESDRYVEYGFTKIDCWEIKSAIFMYTDGAIKSRKTAIDAVNNDDRPAFLEAIEDAETLIKTASHWSTVFDAICKE